SLTGGRQNPGTDQSAPEAALAGCGLRSRSRLGHTGFSHHTCTTPVGVPRPARPAMLPEMTQGDDGATAPPARDRRPPDRVALSADLRAALPDAGAAVLVTVAVFAFLYARMESGDSATVAVMPFMDDPGTYWMYLLSQ